MLIADSTRKSSNGTRGAAKSAGQWLELRSITYNGAAKPVRILGKISLPSVRRAIGGFTYEPEALPSIRRKVDRAGEIHEFRSSIEEGIE